MRRPGDTHASQPVILAVDDEADALARLEHELRRRFGADYEIVGCGSGDEARRTLDAMRAAETEVAVVLADQWMPGTTGAPR